MRTNNLHFLWCVALQLKALQWCAGAPDYRGVRMITDAVGWGGRLKSKFIICSLSNGNCGLHVQWRGKSLGMIKTTHAICCTRRSACVTPP
jgi:hypothetical protein